MALYTSKLTQNLVALISNHTDGNPTPINLSSFLRFGSLAALALVIQIITGVLQACEAAGNVIPRFCYHEKFSVFSVAGSCRKKDAVIFSVGACIAPLEVKPTHTGIFDLSNMSSLGQGAFIFIAVVGTAALMGYAGYLTFQYFKPNGTPPVADSTPFNRGESPSPNLPQNNPWNAPLDSSDIPGLGKVADSVAQALPEGTAHTLFEHAAEIINMVGHSPLVTVLGVTVATAATLGANIIDAVTAVGGAGWRFADSILQSLVEGGSTSSGVLPTPTTLTPELSVYNDAVLKRLLQIFRRILEVHLSHNRSVGMEINRELATEGREMLWNQLEIALKKMLSEPRLGDHGDPVNFITREIAAQYHIEVHQLPVELQNPNLFWDILVEIDPELIDRNNFNINGASSEWNKLCLEFIVKLKEASYKP